MKFSTTILSRDANEFLSAKIGLFNLVSTVCLSRISSDPEVVIGDPIDGVDDSDAIYHRLKFNHDH